ncbi:hypothetical protein Peur_073685 [Populus x canadensis]
MKFPSAEARLSEGCEKSSSIKTLEMILKFFKAASLLQQPLEELIGECLANFLVADMMFHGLQELQSNLGSQGKYSVLSNKMDEILQAELESYGVIVNSFHELGPAYSEHYKKFCTFVLEACPNLIFQLLSYLRLQKALADSGQNFIRVVKNGEKTKGEDREEWLPEGFEKKGGRKCQWKIYDSLWIELSTRGKYCRVSMVTWPLCAEQNHNERLIIEVLKIRVAVGAQEWSRHEREILVKREEIEMAIIQLLVGEEAEELRNRAQALREMAMRTTEEEGSSCCNLKALLKELRAIKTTSY